MPLARDPRVPLWFKALAVAAAVLIVSPVDILGDIPVIGLFDDVTLLALLLGFFVMQAERFTQREVVYAQQARVVRPALEP